MGKQIIFSELELSGLLPLKWPSGRLKVLIKELPVGDQPVGRINQLSGHTFPGLGHPFVTASYSRCGYVILARGPSTDQGNLRMWPGDLTSGPLASKGRLADSTSLQWRPVGPVTPSPAPALTGGRTIMMASGRA